MTEENRENCNFQQNYNVFGLDDKPCCYLYHKYCDEIDSCYFKRCKRLEQENKELKELKCKFKEYCTCDTEKYRSALEEIREKIKSLNKDICDNCGWYNTDNCQPNGYVCHDLIEIKNKINEVLK